MAINYALPIFIHIITNGGIKKMPDRDGNGPRPRSPRPSKPKGGQGKGGC